MKLKLNELLRDKFVRGTFILTAANFGGAFLNYLVHPILTRRLSIAAYGDFQALLSFVTVLGVLTVVVNTSLVKEVSALSADRPEEIDALRRRAVRRFFWLGMAMFVLIAIFAGTLNRSFKIGEETILIIASLSFLYSFSLAVHRAVLSGRQNFSGLAISNFLESFFRLFLVVFLVLAWPLGINGAAWALGLAGSIAFALSFYQIKKLKLPLSPAGFRPTLGRFWRYSLLVLWFTVLTQFFYNFDMLLVKSFFSPEEAGLYGALLTIGRIIYFVGGAVPLVMFPVIANLKKEDGHRCYTILGKSLALMAVLVVPVYLVMYLWPESVVRVIVGVKYVMVAPYISSFGLVMLALSLVYVLSSYFLALADRRGLLIMTGAVILEIVLLSLFHDDIAQVITSLGISFTAAALGLLGLVFIGYRDDKSNCKQPL